MWYQVVQYFKFLRKSTNQHGVHSPFVYNLVIKCFYDKTEYVDYKTLIQHRKRLLTNKNTISITDFGSGSRVFKSSSRKISDIAKHAGVSRKRAQLLHRIVSYFQTKIALELGTSLGLATSAMAIGHPNANIKTIEGCPETAKTAKQQFEAFQLQNIDLRVNSFEKELVNLKDQSFDLIYVDGNHNKEATLNYFETLLQTTHNNSVMIFDDIYWSKDMTEAWEEIKRHPKVTVTIDTFFWGIVFFRKEQAKEHFTIRV